MRPTGAGQLRVATEVEANLAASAASAWAWMVNVRSISRLNSEFVRKGSVTVYHPVGTCKMGRGDDPTTVVDSRGRVKGLRGLRVADASIMPTIIRLASLANGRTAHRITIRLLGCGCSVGVPGHDSGNTNAPSIMIGERIAAMVLLDLV